jgi:hypothetical protein
MIGGTAVGAFSSIRSGQQQAKAMNEQAKALEADERRVAAEAVQKVEAQRRMARDVMGAQRAAVIQNVGGTYGSATDVLAESATMAELDTMNLEYEAVTQRRALLANAKALRKGAREARLAGYIGAVGGAMSGGAQAGYMSATMPKAPPKVG